MVNPLISVIVPVYKTEPYLSKCLDSICGQTYRNLEIICVDDESPDNSGDILEEYAKKDCRIKVIHRKNGGLSAARNSGLSAATGEWVTGVDSDDYLEPDIYEKAVQKLSKQVDILVFGTQLQYEEGVTHVNREQYFSLPDEGFLEQGEQMATSINVCFWNKLWRRSFIDQHHVAFPEGFVHEDQYFFRCLAPFAKGIYILPHVGYNYLQRVGSIMNDGQNTGRMCQSNLLIIEKLIQYHLSSGTLIHAREYVLPYWMDQLHFVRFPGSPPEWKNMLRSRSRSIISRYHLLRHLGGDLRLYQLLPLPWWKRPFVKLYPHCITYRFFGIPLYSVRYEGNLPPSY